MEPLVLFDHFHFCGCDVELEEQRLGLLDQRRYCWHSGYRLYLLRPRSRLHTCVAWYSGPSIVGASDGFLDNRPTDANQSCDTELGGRQPAIVALRYRVDVMPNRLGRVRASPSRMTGNPETIHLGEKRAICRSGFAGRRGCTLGAL